MTTTSPAKRRDYRGFPGVPAEERFWSKVEVARNGCWLWVAGHSPEGYGVFQPSPKKRAYAHRWAYEFLVGPIPAGLQIDHLCRTRDCLNPDHLEPVTSAVNTHRGATQIHRTVCPAGHPYDDVNTYRHNGRRYCYACRRARGTTVRQLIRQQRKATA